MLKEDKKRKSKVSYNQRKSYNHQNQKLNNFLKTLKIQCFRDLTMIFKKSYKTQTYKKQAKSTLKEFKKL